MNPIIQPPKQEPEYLKHFLSFCHRRRFPPKVDIIRPGDPADTLLYLVEGSVAVVLEDEDGHEMIITYLNKGEFIGEMGMFTSEDPPVRSSLVRTRSECILAEISYTRLIQLFDNELKPWTKDILFAVATQLTERLIYTNNKVQNLAFVDVTGRIASTLLELCKQPDAMTHPDGMQIRITRQELGRIVGCSREMAGRVLRNLEEQGLIHVKGKTIVVFNTR